MTELTLPKIKIEWKQEGNKVFFDYKGKEIFFLMPEGYDLSKTHPDLLKLSEWLMFSPWYDLEMENYKWTRNRGKNTILNFSTGVDSTANMILLPQETYLVYVERYNVEDTFLNQSNAFRMIDYLDSLGRKVIKVRTNFEVIRTFHDLMIGYSTAIGMGVPAILLADYLDVGILSYGKVFDDQFFPKGIFRDYTKDYMDRQGYLLGAGLLGLYPTVGCSEVITTKIVDNSQYKNYSFSCVRGMSGTQCNNCYKCFRKSILRGIPIPLDRSSASILEHQPPKMCTSLTYGLNTQRLQLMGLEYLSNIDVSMLNKVYSSAYNIYDEKDKQEVLSRLKQLGFDVMTPEEEEKLRKLNFFKLPQDLNTIY